MYQAGILQPVHTRHFLVGDFDEESKPHGHEYRFEFICSADKLDENGFCVDIALMEEAAAAVADRLGGMLLNDLPFFSDKQTSVENFSQFLLQELFVYMKTRGFLESSISSAEVKVWESNSAWASFAWTAE